MHKKTVFFLTIDNILPAGDPLKFRKNLLPSYKILDRKNMQNDGQYDLGRKAAKISALSSNNLGKYEYLTGEDLGFKPSTVGQAKFEYSPLDKIFNKGLHKVVDKNEGLLKRLKNIKNKIKSKNKNQLEPIKDQSTMDDKKPKETVLIKDRLDNIFRNFGLNSTGKKFLKRLAKDEKEIDYNNLFFKTYNKFIVKNVDFLKEFGTLCDLFWYIV